MNYVYIRGGKYFASGQVVRVSRLVLFFFPLAHVVCCAFGLVLRQIRERS